TSATTTMILAVPMSSPTTRSLYSLGMMVRALPVRGCAGVGGVVAGGRHAADAQRVAVGVAQVHGLQRACGAFGELGQGADEALHAGLQLLGRAAAEFDDRAAVQPRAPGAALAELQAVQAELQARELRLQGLVHGQHLARPVLGAGEFGQLV